MNRIVGRLWAATVLGGLSLGSCQLEPTTGHNVALLYGISNYGNTSVIRNLSYPDLDVEAMSSLLSSSNGGVFSTVIPRTNSKATKAQLKTDITTAAAELGPDSEFLFYYSGHGAQGYAGAVGHAVIVPYGDTSISTVPTYSASTMVTEDELRDLLSSLPTKKIVVILDCCYSGGFLQMPSGGDGVPQDSASYYTALWKAFLAGKAPAAGTDLASWYQETSTDETTALASWTKSLAAGSGFAADQAQLLTAAGALEQSYDDPKTEHGAFTHFLLEAKDHGDLDGNGYVTVSEAYRYAFEGLQQEWNGVWGAVGAGNFSTGGSSAFLPHLSRGPADYLLFKK